MAEEPFTGGWGSFGHREQALLPSSPDGAGNALLLGALGGIGGAAFGAWFFVKANCREAEDGNTYCSEDARDSDLFWASVIGGALAGIWFGVKLAQKQAAGPAGFLSWAGGENPRFSVPTLGFSPKSKHLVIPIISYRFFR